MVHLTLWLLLIIILSNFGYFLQSPKIKYLMSSGIFRPWLKREQEKYKIHPLRQWRWVYWPFDNYCRLHSIQHQKTLPKTPRLNDLAERINKILVERVICLLSDSKLPDSFWAESLNIVTYDINLSTTIASDGDVPYRVWFDKNIFYDYLRVFRCNTFVHTPKNERSKLNVKTR